MTNLRNLLQTKTAIAAVLVVGCLLICFSCYGIYDRYHISSDLKRSLIAATDTHSNMYDVRDYLRQARLQVRTTKDKEVLASYQGALDLLIEANALAAKYESDSNDLAVDIEKAKIASVDDSHIDETKNGLRRRIGTLRQEHDKALKQFATAQQLFELARKDLGLASTKDSWSTKTLPELNSSSR